MWSELNCRFFGRTLLTIVIGVVRRIEHHIYILTPHAPPKKHRRHLFTSKCYPFFYFIFLYIYIYIKRSIHPLPHIKITKKSKYSCIKS
jgi:hypothetical protein